MAETGTTNPICPLIYAALKAKGRVAEPELAAVCRDDCAWYNTLSERCALQDIAVALKAMRKI